MKHAVCSGVGALADAAAVAAVVEDEGYLTVVETDSGQAAVVSTVKRETLGSLTLRQRQSGAVGERVKACEG